jgi:hypothetical protein
MEFFKREGAAKGAWLLGFVRLGGFRGLDIRFLGGKWQKKNADPHSTSLRAGYAGGQKRRGVGWAEAEVEKRISGGGSV